MDIPTQVVRYLHMVRLALGTEKSLPRALAVADGSDWSPPLAQASRYVRLGVAVGLPFSAALSVHPHVFGEPVVELVRVGERAGDLPAALERAGTYLDTQVQPDWKFRRSLHCLLAVLTLALAVVTALLVYVIPQFKALFDSMCVELPATTQALITASDLCSRWPLLACLGALLFPVYCFRSLVRARRAFGVRRWLSRVPLLGRPEKTAVLWAASRRMGVLLEGGVSLAAAVALVSRDGALPAYLLALARNRPDPLALGRALTGIALALETQLERQTNTRWMIVELGAIVAMGALIVGIVLAIFMPMCRLTCSVG
jgi:type IV pilus assembly protein PilC